MKRVGLAAAVAALLLVASSAQAATPAIDIHSAGPLSDIYIGNDLSCQVRSGGFSSTEFFPNASGPGDCGTFYNTGSDSFQTELLGPDFGHHAGGTQYRRSPTPSPIHSSQAVVRRVGDLDDPYRVTTIVTGVDPPSSGTGPSAVLTFTQVDTYSSAKTRPHRPHRREHGARVHERHGSRLPRG